MRFPFTGLLAAFCVFGIVFGALTLHAEEPNQVPSHDLFEALYVLLEEVAFVEAFQCPAGDCPCPALVGAGEERFCAEEIRSEAERPGLESDSFAFSILDAVLRGEKLTLEIEESDSGRLEIEGLRYQNTHKEDSRTLRAARGVLRFHAGVLVEATLEEVSWDGELQAERLHFKEDGWTLDGVHGAFRQALPGTLPVDQARSGFLPPEIFLSSGQSRLSMGYYLARPSLSAHAALYHPGAFGLEVGHWSARDSSSPEVASLELQASTQGIAGLTFGGRAVVSPGAFELETSGDSLAYFIDSPPSWDWQTHRDRLAATRSWRSRQVGLQVHGEHATLQLYGQGAAASPLSFTRGERLFDDARFGMRFRTNLRLPQLIEGSLDVLHLEAKTLESRGRLTRINVELDRTFGSLNRLYLHPRLHSNLGINVLDTPSGSQAFHQTYIDTSLEAGLGLRGYPGGVTHDVRPSLLIARRTHFGRDELLPFAVDEPYETFHLLAFQLRQTLHGRRLRVEVPLRLVGIQAPGERLQVSSTYALRIVPVQRGPFRIQATLDGELNLSDQNLGLRLSLEGYLRKSLSIVAGGMTGTFDPRLTVLRGAQTWNRGMDNEEPLLFSLLHLQHRRVEGTLGWTGALRRDHEQAWIARGAWRTLSGVRLGMHVAYSPQHQWTIALGLHR